jgi:hypothetical protein
VPSDRLTTQDAFTAEACAMQRTCETACSVLIAKKATVGIMQVYCDVEPVVLF